ncbi:UvrD-helicase domain-containing protein [Phycicoccus sp. DTK01]|uniref:UvrD-helicase domain-containing protein n=1 Tax=Phycicoccus sp. DTK01 TaxID=2785745 RepID=UPI001A8DEE57|nr:UvrD-helicase domain-containing protein [Phycicoccus sp. DTK01]GIL33999.1 DNA helicase [Phycicoccus sp. DTK01]
MSVIITRSVSRLEPALRAKAFAFVEKLNEDHALPGLHIEPIQNSADARVRTGRVDQGYRAVLFRLTRPDAVDYVLHGIWPHDDAIAVAKKVCLTVNPISGVPEIIEATAPAPAETPARDEVAAPRAADAVRTPEARPHLIGYGVGDLVEGLGLDRGFAEQVLGAHDEDALLAVAAVAPAEWQGLAVLDLAGGLSVDDIKDRLGLEAPVASESVSDEQIVDALQRPAGRLSFAWIESNEELERVVEEGDFGDWRVFLHPEQRRFVDRDYRGPARVTGGAGTGKTVVVLHRARALARRAPIPRVLVTTYTRNLADMLERDLVRLDPSVPMSKAIGRSGVMVSGIDAFAAQVVREAQGAIRNATEAVLGVATLDVIDRTPEAAWDEAVALGGQDLPEPLRNRSFLTDEYAQVVLPHGITSLTQYLRVRRPGRGVALDRVKRTAVWNVVAAYRASARAHGRVDFAEVAALAAKHLELEALAGRGRPFDHVLVDEAQDLSTSHWKLLRAAVAPGPNDLFISEDAHQRIYGNRITLSHVGIDVVGRARRLTLNYRTTAQNLRWAMSVLDGGDYSDLAGEAEDHTGYRSARSGPPVSLRRCADQDEELDAAAADLKQWIDAGDPGETLAVLVKDRYQQERVVNGLAERGVKAQSVGQGNPKAGRPVVMTMHRSKGTEFGKVILLGVREGAFPAGLRELAYEDTARTDGLLRERSLLYVAATRARDLLVVSWSGKASPLVSVPA